MNCSQIRKKLSAFSDGEVSEEKKQLISEHLKSCELCRKELIALSHVSGALGIMDEVQVSPFFITRLKQRITEQEKERGIHLPFMEWIKRVAIPVAATVFVFLSFLVGSNLGKAIYREHAKTVAKSNNKVVDALGVAALDEFPEGSLGWAYNSVLTGGE